MRSNRAEPIEQVSADLIANLRTASDICVFTSGYPPGACCIGVAGTVAATLRYYEVDARVVAGGVCYRAGPHPKWDVAAFCGPDNRADPERKLYHAWVETRDRSNGGCWLLDFTPKYWADDRYRPRDFIPPGYPQPPPINWWVKPPDELIGPMSDFAYRLGPGEHTPPLGKMTIVPCQRMTAIVREMLAQMPTMKVERSAP